MTFQRGTNYQHAGTAISSYNPPKPGITVSREPADLARVGGGAMSGIRSTQVTVATTPAKLPPAALPGRTKMTVQNIGAGTLYLGGPAVGTGSGLQLSSGDSWEERVNDAAVLYGISDTGCDVRILEVSEG